MSLFNRFFGFGVRTVLFSITVSFIMFPVLASAAIPAQVANALKAGGVNLVFSWYDVDSYNPTGFDAELPLIYAAGGRHVRLVISMDILEQGTTGSLRMDRWQDLKNFVAKAKSNGLVTIIDVHNTGQKNPDGSWTNDYMGKIADAGVQARHTKLNVELAQKAYAELDRDWIALQPGNEPLNDAWNSYQDQLMPKMRAACADCVIFAFTTNWQSMGSTMWTLNPKTKTWWDDRFVLDVHMYAPTSLSHCSFPGMPNNCPSKSWPGYYNDWLPVSGTLFAGTWDKNTLKNEFDKFWAWRSTAGNPTVHFSEIGTTGDLADSVRGAYLKDVTDLLYANGAGWSCYEWNSNFGIKNAPLTKAACFRGIASTSPTPPPPPPPPSPTPTPTSTPSPSPTPTPAAGIFSLGGRIVTIQSVAVRATANGTKLGSQQTNSLGTVLGGPMVTGGYTWWKIDYAAGVDGWSVEPFLADRKSVV